MYGMRKEFLRYHTQVILINRILMMTMQTWSMLWNKVSMSFSHEVKVGAASRV